MALGVILGRDVPSLCLLDWCVHTWDPQALRIPNPCTPHVPTRVSGLCQTPVSWLRCSHQTRIENNSLLPSPVLLISTCLTGSLFAPVCPQGPMGPRTEALIHPWSCSVCWDCSSIPSGKDGELGFLGKAGWSQSPGNCEARTLLGSGEVFCEREKQPSPRTPGAVSHQPASLLPWTKPGLLQEVRSECWVLAQLHCPAQLSVVPAVLEALCATEITVLLLQKRQFVWENTV